jgi:hypothetical protein
MGWTTPGDGLGVNSAPVILPDLVWRQSPNFSSRGGAMVRLIVWHATMGAYAGAISWLCNPQAQASANAVEREDGGQATQLVQWGRKAWHVAAYNSVAEGLEMAGSGPSWPLQQLRVAARIIAYRLHARGLPPRYARWGIGLGFCRHKDLGLAGGGHVDPPMSLATWNLCKWLVKREAARGGFRPSWGRR